MSIIHIGRPESTVFLFERVCLRDRRWRRTLLLCPPVTPRCPFFFFFNAAPPPELSPLPPPAPLPIAAGPRREGPLGGEEQSGAATRLYEDLGFERVRLLEVWSLDAEVQASDVRVAEPSPAGERDLPWQRADASLRPGYERLEVDGGAAVVRGSGGTISLLQLRADDLDAARALVAAARARGTGLRFVNAPEGHVGTAALAELGGRLVVRQFEMRLSRRSSAPRG